MEGPSPERLNPAIATGRTRVFGAKEKEGQRMLRLEEACCQCHARSYYLWAEAEEMDRAKRRKMNRRIDPVWMESEKPGAMKSFA